MDKRIEEKIKEIAGLLEEGQSASMMLHGFNVYNLDDRYELTGMVSKNLKEAYPVAKCHFGKINVTIFG